jgi:signal transduction histidine kinase
MRKQFALLLSFSLLFTGLFSQTERSKQTMLSALKKERAEHPEASLADTTQIKLLLRLAELYETENNDSALIAGEEALNLSLALQNTGSYENPSHAQEIDRWTGSAYSMLGKHQMAFESYQASIDNYKEALAIWEKLKADSDIIEALSAIGNALTARGEFSEALNYHFKALQVCERLKDKKKMSVALSSIGVAYGQLDKREKALEYFQRALKMAEELGDKRSIGIRLGNIGQVYARMHDHERAMGYYLRALKIAEGDGDEESIAFRTLNIGGAYTNMMGELDQSATRSSYAKSARENLQRSLDLFTKLDDKSGMLGPLRLFGQLNKLEKNYKAAELYYKKGLALAQEIGSALDIADFSEEISYLYEETGDTKQALYYYKQYIDITDSIYSAENKEQMIRTEVNYEYDKKTALEKAAHEKEVALLEAEHKNTRNIVMLVSAIVLLLLVAGFVFFNIRKNLRVKEEYARHLLTGQEKERQRISKELHDGVGQHILFLRNRLVKLNDEALVSSADETLEEVRTLSKNLYPNQLEKYGLIAAVDAMVKRVQETSVIFVSHDLEGFKQELSSEQQINFYRIIQECISNTLKHAAASALRITATAGEKGIELVIQDDGKGFDKQKLKQAAQRSFGVLNLEERVRLLNGNTSLETSPGNGTKWTFFIPTHIA